MTPKPLGMPPSIWLLGVVSMLTDISSEMVHSLLPMFLMTSMGASVFIVGLIEGLAEFTALILKIFSGALSDYWGRRKGLVLAGYALSAFTKPIFPLAMSVPVVLGARLVDRLGKGVRDAPRDALIADMTPASLRGAAFGLRQSLDTIGAFIGPIIAVLLMAVWAYDIRIVFWLACIPAVMAVVLLFFVKEEVREQSATLQNPLNISLLKMLGKSYVWVVVLGGLLGLARFSDAFLVLRAFNSGIPMMFVPLIMVVMNVVYAASAYPFGKLSDRVGHVKLLGFGIFSLVIANLSFALGSHWIYVVVGVAFWGLHMGLTQGVMASWIAMVTPANLRGTGYGFYNLVLGFAMLFASVMGGLLWDYWGASYTFVASAIIGLISLLLLKNLSVQVQTEGVSPD